MEDTIRVIPQELSGDTKIGKHFYFTDAAVIVFYFVVASNLENFVHEDLVSFFYLFNVIVSIAMVIPSRQNPRRRMWTTYLFALIKDNTVYENLPISTEKIKMTKEEMKEIYQREMYAMSLYENSQAPNGGVFNDEN